MKRSLAFFSFLCLLASSFAGPARPNILFIYGDDWMYPHASCLGDPLVKTPVFDRLAREGVLFHNAFTAAPSCSPSRAAILTGRWPWLLGEGANLRGLILREVFIDPGRYFRDRKIELYPDLLAAAGYFIGLSGKGYSPAEILRNRAVDPAGPAFKSFADFLAARPKGKPFCFWFGSINPHRPYVSDSGVRSGLDPARITLPPFLPDNETVRKDLCDYYYEVQALDAEAGALLAQLERAGELDHTLIVMSGDNGMPFPRSKATLYETGTHQPLAIRWGAKVKGGREVSDFVSLSDLAPTFLEAAGVSVPKAMTARSLLPILLSNKSGQIDSARDHVLSGMETHLPCHRLPDGTQAGYPMRLLRTRDFHYVRNFHPERWPAGDPNGFEVPGATPATYQQLCKSPYVAFADCDEGPAKAWLVVHRDEPAVRPCFERAFAKRPARELYDNRKDPYQLTNLAADPAYAHVVARLDAQLMAELEATDDPRATGREIELDKLNTATWTDPREVVRKSREAINPGAKSR